MKPVFIGGTGRSGTTILKQVLMHHPQIAAIPRELRVIVDPYGALDLKQALSERWSPYNADHAIRNFRKLMMKSRSVSLWARAERKYFPKFGIAPRRYITMGFDKHFGKPYYQNRLKKLLSDLSYHVARGNWDGTPSLQLLPEIYETDYLGNETIDSLLGNFFRDLYAQRNPDGSKTHWIEDTPYNLLQVPELRDLFPDMKFLHIYRDLRDVLASYFRHDWGGDDMNATARRLANIIKRWLIIRESLPADMFLEVRLEALAAAPGEEFQKICDFIGIPFADQLKDNVAALNVDRMHGGRWEREIPAEKQAEIINILAPALSAYGYVEAEK